MHEGQAGRIVGEHHEDWVVIRGDDAELVSGKHRELGYSVFTTAGQLAGNGGLESQSRLKSCQALPDHASMVYSSPILAGTDLWQARELLVPDAKK
jgi:hypothetical protein